MILLAGCGGSSKTISTANPPAPTTKFQGTVIDPNLAIPVLSEFSGPNGVVTVGPHTEAWVTDAPSLHGPLVLSATPSIAYGASDCNSSVKVINLQSTQVTDVIPTNGCFRSDELAYDPADQVVLVANPAEQDIKSAMQTGPKNSFISLISAAPVAAGATHNILKQIPFDGTSGTPDTTQGPGPTGIEQSVWNPADGLFYVAVPQDGPDPTVGAIAVVDPVALSVVKKLPVTGGCGTAGISLGPDNQELFLSCGQVIATSDGHLIQAVPQVVGCDETWYDAHTNHYLAACQLGGPTAQIDVVDAGSNTYLSNLIDNPTFDFVSVVHSVAADAVTGNIVVPVPAVNGLCGTAPGDPAGCFAIFSDDPATGAMTQIATIPWASMDSDISFIDPVTRMYFLADRSNSSLDVLLLDHFIPFAISPQ